MILLIDNYDSFTYNLYQAVGVLTKDITVARNDEITIEEIEKMSPAAIIISPGPGYPKDAGISEEVIKTFSGRIPILGVCLGHQAIAAFGGKIVHAKQQLHGKQTDINLNTANPLFSGLKSTIKAARYHSLVVDSISLPTCLSVIATDDKAQIMAIRHREHPTYGVQFHPEVTHSEYGNVILKNFLYEVCGCKGDWVMDNFIENTVAKLKEQIGDKKVVLGLSGGVDSSVAAGLISRAVGKQLTCVFVDQGLMRKDEGDFVEETFTRLFDMRFVRVNCQKQFLEKLKGITDPEEKRKTIGTEFYKVFWDKIREEADGGFFAQGTIYPDRIESGKGDAATIKTHHNQVKMPEDINFDGVIEPLGDLFKDEVRKVGEKLGIPKELVWRQPFPGPGLGVRIIGEITEDKIKVLQEADAVFRDEIKKSGIESSLSQFFAVLPNVQTVGVMGDHRTYDHLIAIRAVTTDDFMTADWAHLPYEFLGKISNDIINKVKGVNRVTYDISSKPPATIEWE